MALTVLVDEGRLEPAFRSGAYVRTSSPQKSPSFSNPRLKNPILPPSVVTLSKRPRIMNSISSDYIGTLCINLALKRSQMVSSKRLSLLANKGTCIFHHVTNYTWKCLWTQMTTSWSHTRVSLDLKSPQPTILTLLTKFKQRCRLMSLLRSFGRLWTMLSSSTPRVSSHLYWLYRRTFSLSSCGSKWWCIHCSESRLLILISLSRIVMDWR